MAIKALILDFDGVLTNNHVYLLENGMEIVRFSKLDSLGMYYLQQKGVRTLIVSHETNPVVQHRAKKLKCDCINGDMDKGDEIQKWMDDLGFKQEEVVYIGNDINDLEVIGVVGTFVAVNNAVNKVKDVANYVTKASGGDGAVREICDMILNGEFV